MKYLMCMYGKEHHSFIWIGGKFVGNGFMFDRKVMSDDSFKGMLQGKGVVYDCQREGDLNLLGGPLESCTQMNDGTTTGWTRSGSCVWDPSDSGYHQVCVTVTDEFLASS